jgi:hypothetical protein
MSYYLPALAVLAAFIYGEVRWHMGFTRGSK